MEELIIEPGRAERNYWRDLWRFRESPLLPRLPRHPGPLQTDRNRDSVGSHPATHGNAGLRCLPSARPRRVPIASSRRHSRLLRNSALAILLHGFIRSLR